MPFAILSKSRGSIATRFFLFYIAGLGLLILIFTQSLWQVSEGAVERQMDATIRTDTKGLIELYQHTGQAGLSKILSKRIQTHLDGTAVYLLVDDQFTPRLGTISFWPDMIGQYPHWGEIDWNDDDRYELRYLVRQLTDGGYLLVGRVNAEVEWLENQSAVIFLIVVGATLLIGSIGGVVLHYRLQRRFARIHMACQKISEGNFDHRLDHAAEGDELDQMARVLNQMMDQISTLMAGLQSVTDNIAHDMRTPLTQVRGQLDDLLNEIQQVNERERVAEIISKVDGLISTFNSLLTIGKIEATSGKDRHSSIRLEEIVSDVIELYEPIAEDREIEVDFHAETSTSMIADRDLVFQCLVNVLDNAVKFSPQQSHIHIDIDQSFAGEVRVTVADEGIGIPEEELTRVLDRFYRVDASRQTRGNGLGLALVSAIMARHGGRVLLENRSSAAGQKGLIVTLVFPV